MGLTIVDYSNTFSPKLSDMSTAFNFFSKYSLMTKLLFLSSFAFFSFTSIQLPLAPKKANVEEIASEINWVTWEELETLSQKAPKKVIIDLYTDWCHWCKVMDKETYRNKEIAQYINENYYAVKFNAETKSSIQFKGKKYGYRSGGKRGYNELAAELTGGRLGYPTTVILDENLKVIQSIAGYQKPLNFEQIITYFGGDFHQKMSWNNFKANFKPIGQE